MDNVWSVILDFKYLIVIAVPLGAISFAVGVFFAENITWTGRRLKFFGLLRDLKPNETLWLAACALRWVFVASLFFFGVRQATAHIIFYILVSFLCCALLPGMKRVVLEIVNAGVIYVAMTALSVLIGYYKDVYSDPLFFVIYCLLGVFALLYILYFFMRGISDMVTRKITYAGTGVRGKTGNVNDIGGSGE
jgi:hypothetical protein